jgi:membrane associated rhomboid family serine protease
MLPLRDENPVSRPPIITWLIIAACIAAYLVWQPGPFDTSDTTDDVVFYLDNAAIPCEVREGRPLDVQEVTATYQGGDVESCDIDDGRSDPFVPDKNVWLSVVVSMFLHGSLWHIGGNMLFLWVFGNNVEDVMGRLAFVVFYFVGGVLGTVAHVALNPDSTVPVVGASGAIAAVMGAYLVLFPTAKVRTWIIMLLIVVVDIRAAWLLMIWFVLQFFTDPNEGVAWAAHVAGFLFGILAGLLVRAVRGPIRPVPVGSASR